MENAVSSNTYMPSEKTEKSNKQVKPKLEEVLKREVEDLNPTAGGWMSRVSFVLQEGSRFVQKNPYTGILISTSAGVAIGFALSSYVRSLRQ